MKPQTQKKRDKWFEILDYYCKLPYSADLIINDLLNVRAAQGYVDIVHEVMFSEQFAVILLCDFQRIVFQKMTIQQRRSRNFQYKNMLTHTEKEHFMKM